MQNPGAVSYTSRGVLVPKPPNQTPLPFLLEGRPSGLELPNVCLRISLWRFWATIGGARSDRPLELGALWLTSPATPASERNGVFISVDMEGNGPASSTCSR